MAHGVCSPGSGAHTHSHEHAPAHAHKFTLQLRHGAAAASAFCKPSRAHADKDPVFRGNLEVEVEALRIGSVVANQWRAESLELSDKLRRVQQVLWSNLAVIPNPDSGCI
jgi:hypothetical protein